MSVTPQAPKRPIITTPYSPTNPLVLNPTLRSGYCIATALRGPDNNGAQGNLTVKLLTASVLRWFCGMVDQTSMGFYCPIVVNPNNVSLNASELAAARVLWAGPSSNSWYALGGYVSHYTAHMREAFAALAIELNVPGAQSYWTWLDELLNPAKTPEVRSIYAYHQS